MNAYTSISGGGFQPPSPTYDPNGNTLTLPRPDGVSQSLSWDIHNRLRTASSFHDPQSSISNIYDPLGRLVWTRTTTTGQPATDEVWSWSGWTLLTREVLQGSTPIDTFRYTWGPDLSNTLEGAGGVGGLLAIEHAAGSSTTWDIRHAHYDANGNIIALSSETGAISARYRYSPFGELLTSEDLDNSGWNERNIHFFSTKPEVPGTGLLYYGYRWYDPATGRWPSRDPIEEKGGVGLSLFVSNNPINAVDLIGMNMININIEGTTGGMNIDINTTSEKCDASLDNSTMTVYGFGNSEYDAGVTIAFGRVYTLVGVSSKLETCETGPFIPVGGPPGGMFPNREIKCPGERCRITISVRVQDVWAWVTTKGRVLTEDFVTACKRK